MLMASPLSEAIYGLRIETTTWDARAVKLRHRSGGITQGIVELPRVRERHNAGTGHDVMRSQKIHEIHVQDVVCGGKEHSGVVDVDGNLVNLRRVWRDERAAQLHPLGLSTN